MRRTNSKNKIIVALLALLVIGGGGFAYSKWRKESNPTPKFSIVKVERGDIRVFVQATGTVQPENRLVIKAPINGRIEKVLIEEGKHVNRGQILAYMSSVDRAALIDAARAKGDEEVKHWEDIYRSTPIVAPMSGLIIARSVEPGQTITTTDSIFVMSDQLTVVAQVDETDIAKISLKQPVSISLDAYPNQRIVGTVHHIAFEAKTVNNVTVYDVQVLPDEVPAVMRSGMTASVKFLISERMGVVTLPASAIKSERSKSYVFIPSPDWEKKAAPETREIQIGLSDGRVTEISEGLKVGEDVLQEMLKIPDAKNNGGNPFSPMGGSNRRQSGGSKPPAPHR